jgi:hypothetical protein
MERAQVLVNFRTIVQLFAWVLSLDGVIGYFQFRHFYTLLRRFVTIALDRDPSIPRVPDTYESWAEWYNS